MKIPHQVLGGLLASLAALSAQAHVAAAQAGDCYSVRGRIERSKTNQLEIVVNEGSRDESHVRLRVTEPLPDWARTGSWLGARARIEQTGGAQGPLAHPRPRSLYLTHPFLERKHPGWQRLDRNACT